MYRRVIRITGDDSPNVRHAKLQIARGQEPDGTMLVPGVLSWAKYCKRMAMWDDVRKCVGIHARFWRGGEVLLFPSAALTLAEHIAEHCRDRNRRALGIGVDTGQGRASTSMTAVDAVGIIEQRSRRTPDTAVIAPEVIAFMREHCCSPDRVFFDLGGGGLQVADQLRSQGMDVRTVPFGAAVSPDYRTGITPLTQRIADAEQRYAYYNRRAQMYGEASLLVEGGYGIPAECTELLRQLAPLPRSYDAEGRLKLLPKHGTKDSMQALLGCSPDEADSFVLAVHAMLHDPMPSYAGPMR